MKTIAGILMTLLSCAVLLSIAAYEKDAVGCKDSPLAPRMQGYYIVGCDDHDGNADFEIPKGDGTETVHVEGKSVAVMYSPQPDMKQKPTEAQLKADFEKAMKGEGAAFMCTTPGQNWPVYRLLKGDKEYWIVLLVNSAEYFTGSYAIRVIERGGAK